jgi:nucleolar pre-ribosomal-associated protein 2
MEYIRMQLGARLEPELKSALLPGLYAILDAMTVEGRQVLNAELDAEGRAVWRVLYAEWNRFGRWTE